MDKHFLRAKDVARMIEEYLESQNREKPERLEAWLTESKEHRAFFDDLLSRAKTAERLGFYDSIDTKHEWRLFLQKQRGSVKRRHITLRWAAGIASSLILAAGIGLLLTDRITDTVAQVTGEKIYPGERKAVFIAGDREIEITRDIQIRNGQRTIITDTRGNSLYESEESISAISQRIIVPRGGEYDLMLSDGTRIWLNSETELTYPEKFDPIHREITIKGEAYLEVAHNSELPFYVNIDIARVRVLGTSFAVNNYTNEPDITVSLVSGCVRIETLSGKELTELSPSQQFSMNSKTGEFAVGSFDKQSLLDWKNNLFIFKNEDLASIARRLERWYDLEITVDPILQNNRYTGVMDRHSSLQPIIFILTDTDEMEVLETAPNRIAIQPK